MVTGTVMDTITAVVLTLKVQTPAVVTPTSALSKRVVDTVPVQLLMVVMVTDMDIIAVKWMARLAELGRMLIMVGWNAKNQKMAAGFAVSAVTRA